MATLFNSNTTKREKYLKIVEDLEAELEQKREELRKFTAASSAVVQGNITTTTSTINIKTPTTFGKQGTAVETQDDDVENDVGDSIDASDDEEHN